MGVKSTIDLNRQAAEHRYVKAWLEVKGAKREARVRSELEPLIDAGELRLEYPLSCIDPGPDRLVAIVAQVESLRRRERWTAQARDFLLKADNRTLALELERLNDEANGGEGFENYYVDGDG